MYHTGTVRNPEDVMGFLLFALSSHVFSSDASFADIHSVYLEKFPSFFSPPRLGTQETHNFCVAASKRKTGVAV